LAKGTLIEHYKTLVALGITENVEEFAKRLVVTKVGTRLNILYRPDLANPLYTVAAQIRFEIDFSTY
jgi:phage tail sheath gpL-like